MHFLSFILIFLIFCVPNLDRFDTLEIRRQVCLIPKQIVALHPCTKCLDGGIGRPACQEFSVTCPGGGIGRRAGLKHQYLHGYIGSTPILGTQNRRPANFSRPSFFILIKGYNFFGPCNPSFPGNSLLRRYQCASI